MVPPVSNRVSRVRPYSGTNLIHAQPFAYGAITLYCPTFQKVLLSITWTLLTGPTTPKEELLVWALPTSLAATTGISFDFYSSAYLDVSVRQVSLPYPMYSDKDDMILLISGFPIRKPPDQCFFPAPRRLSQVSASFIAFWCQGIHQQLLAT